LRGRAIARPNATTELAAELGQQGAAREAMARRRAEHATAAELAARVERLPAGCQFRRMLERALLLRLEADAR
jgi:hypothetical protein